MTPRFRKLLLTAHVTLSVGWLGAVAAFLVLSITGLTSGNAETVRGAYLAMNLIAWFVIVPLALASLLSGIVQSLSTSWGLFRHYWVMAKLFLTVVATVVLLLKMKLMGYIAGAATTTALSSADLHRPRMELVVHSGGGLLVLLAITTLSVFKPWGLTRYGQRKQQERQYQLARSPQTVGVNAISVSDNETTSDGLLRRLKLIPVASIGVFLVVVHVYMHLSGHILHHRF